MILNTPDLKQLSVQNWVSSSIGKDKKTGFPYYDRASRKKDLAWSFLKTYGHFHHIIAENLQKGTLKGHLCPPWKCTGHTATHVKRWAWDPWADTFSLLCSMTVLWLYLNQRRIRAMYAWGTNKATYKSQNGKHTGYKRERAQEAKAHDKNQTESGNTLASLLLNLKPKADLLSPSSKAAALYYKTKLCCHNFNVYNLNSKNIAENCLWHEAEGAIRFVFLCSIPTKQL